MDVLAPTTMKNAAKCDTSCELRNPVSHLNFERILHFLRGVCLLECLFIPPIQMCMETTFVRLERDVSMCLDVTDGVKSIDKNVIDSQSM